ncbi:MAG TPA: NAD(P)-dependent oxidoreductase, partial [Burkholderiaceae bacterium]
MRIAVLDDYQAVAHAMADWTSLADCSVEFLHAPLQDVDALAERLRDVDAIVAMRERTKFPAAVFARLPRLRLLVTTGMINRSIDLQAAAERGVRVCGTPWAEDATVEVTWGHVLALAHRIPREDAAMRAGGWQTALGRSLHGRTLGLLGLGTIGSKVARIAQAFGMQVIAHSPNLTPERAAAAGARCVDKAELFRAADVLSIHLILGPT